MMRRLTTELLHADPDGEDIEDAAEAALLGALERRRVAWSNEDDVTSSDLLHPGRTSIERPKLAPSLSESGLQRSPPAELSEGQVSQARPTIRTSSSCKKYRNLPKQRSRRSSLPLFEPCTAESSASRSGLTPSGERARRISVAIKTAGADLSPAMSGTGLNSLLNRIVSQRANENQSTINSKEGASFRRSANGIRSVDLSDGSSDIGVQSSALPSSGETAWNVDKWFKTAEHLQGLGQIDEEIGAKDTTIELTPAAPHLEETGGVDEQTPMLQAPPEIPDSHKAGKCKIWSTPWPFPDSMSDKYLSWRIELDKQLQLFVIAFDATLVKEKLVSFLRNGVMMLIVPAFAISAFFYYGLNNPGFSALPTDASISWWILFIIRHYLTLQSAYATQYFFIDVMAVNSLISFKLIGHIASLYAINSKGWPFILMAWGMLNLVLIQNSDDDNDAMSFSSHWLCFSDIKIFSADNSSMGVVESDTYRRILISMIVAGIAVSLERTYLAVYLGKRIYMHYKPKLEKVMVSMIILNEVASLGCAVGDHEEIPESTLQFASVFLRSNIDDESSGEEGGECASGSWAGLGSDSDDETESLGERGESKLHSQEILDKVEARASQLTVNEEDLLEEEVPDVAFAEAPVTTVHEPVQGIPWNATDTGHIRAHLDEWEEPVNKQDKIDDPTIEEILQFRQALSLLHDTQPFGSSFGPAFSRDSCINSSKELYKRLLRLSPEHPVLHFDAIGQLAYDVDGTFDDKKARSLIHLFRPDKFEEVSLLHFVQSCDGVYKKLRHLRASVGNSTLIDNVLENILVGMCRFVLALVVMSILRLNPWTLLVSMSTVLVSFAFAFGPSAAETIEGMMMIAVRRPFDLGDRISIVDVSSAPVRSEDPNSDDTWLVEDCNLYTTTLRLSRTNEISTVNNGSIAKTRIVNYGRSINALINVVIPMRIDATYDQVQIVKSALQQYIRDNPRVWTSLVDFRITKVDQANQLIEYSGKLQHVKSWQDLWPVLKARGELEKFCSEILTKLGIQYDGDVAINEVLIKELPEGNILPKNVPSQVDHE